MHGQQIIKLFAHVFITCADIYIYIYICVCVFHFSVSGYFEGTDDSLPFLCFFKDVILVPEL